jgi:hypothetical protein
MSNHTCVGQSGNNPCLSDACCCTFRQAVGVAGYEMPEELVAPLRAINALPINLAPEQVGG